jgi:hypothetical protein
LKRLQIAQERIVDAVNTAELPLEIGAVLLLFATGFLEKFDRARPQEFVRFRPGDGTFGRRRYGSKCGARCARRNGEILTWHNSLSVVVGAAVMPPDK